MHKMSTIWETLERGDGLMRLHRSSTHKGGFIGGLVVGLVLSVAALAVYVGSQSQGLVIYVHTQPLTTALDQGLSDATLAELPVAMNQLEAQVPPLLAKQMAAKLGGLSLEVDGVRLPIPASTDKLLEHPLQKAISATLGSYTHGAHLASLSAALDQKAINSLMPQLTSLLLSRPMYVDIGPFHSLRVTLRAVGSVGTHQASSWAVP